MDNIAGKELFQSYVLYQICVVCSKLRYMDASS